MRVRILMAGVTIALAGCGGEAAEKPKKEAAAEKLQAGEYEITATVDQIRSADQSTPASRLKVGAAASTTRTCVGPDGVIPPSAFVEAGETCNPIETYMSRGRMNLQFRCKRPGVGELTQMADGDFKADSFEAKVSTATYFAGSGDYEATRNFTAKRVGACTTAG